ncbi:methyl-accepting chemotaxis protein [Bowmanella denitrificans]|uniref:Methyl-accepting chemotaxis protein n=1 Tax=Bowmanella denitrificans TaxID=366582 RepID=A0ABP3GCR0_9ALTE
MIRTFAIGTRSGAAFGLMGLLVLLVGGLGMLKLHFLNDEITDLAKVRIPALESSTRMLSDFIEVQLQDVNQLYAQGARRKEYRDAMNRAKQALERRLDASRELASHPQIRQALGSIAAQLNNYLQLQNQQMQMLDGGDQNAAIELHAQQMRPLRMALTEQIRALESLELELIEKGADQAHDVYQQSVTWMWAIMAIAAILVVLLAVLFTRALVLPMNTALHAAERIASGDLTVAISDAGSDEPARMIEALIKMRNSLRDTLELIQSSSAQLASTSEELSIVTEQSTRGIHTQNDHLEQAVSAITQLTSSIEDVARNAVAASQESQAMDGQAKAGHKQVQQTVASVQYLLQELTETTAGLDKLSGEINRVSSVLDVIRAIAEQTNLLALNAAIEAARAGESGRGFAVVADEVRALAHRTQESTKEIEGMVNAVQAGTNETVSLMGKSHERAKQSLDVAGSAGNALIEITASVARSAEQNHAIASAAEQQATVSKQIDENLVQIRDVANEVASGASETSASSQELARLAEELDCLTRKFHI